MAERLADGNVIPPGAILVVLTLIFCPVSGAQPNPDIVMACRFLNRFKGIQTVGTAAFVGLQLLASCFASFFQMATARAGFSDDSI